eukprot:2474321-Amphidinium_carterae.1
MEVTTSGMTYHKVGARLAQQASCIRHNRHVMQAQLDLESVLEGGYLQTTSPPRKLHPTYKRKYLQREEQQRESTHVMCTMQSPGVGTATTPSACTSAAPSHTQSKEKGWPAPGATNTHTHTHTP